MSYKRHRIERVIEHITRRITWISQTLLAFETVELTVSEMNAAGDFNGTCTEHGSIGERFLKILWRLLLFSQCRKFLYSIEIHLELFLAERTFEYELFKINESLLTAVYKDLHPRTDINFSGSIENKAQSFVDMLKKNEDKAEFAQSLAEYIQE